MAYDYDKSELDSITKNYIRNTGIYKVGVHQRDELGEYTDQFMGENFPLEEGRKKSKADKQLRNIMEILMKSFTGNSFYEGPERRESTKPQFNIENYRDMTGDDKVDVRDVVKARQLLNRTPQQINQENLKKTFGIDVNEQGQLIDPRIEGPGY